MSDSTNSNCRELTVDFVLRDDDPEMAAVEDDIRRDLLKLNVNVNTRFLNSSDYGDAERNGDYNLLFTRTWGARKYLTCDNRGHILVVLFFEIKFPTLTLVSICRQPTILIPT